MADLYKPSEKVQKYFEILEPEFPEWLWEYVNTPAMLHQRGISTTCGVVYSDLFPEIEEFYSSLDHSVGVALIVWHFTHDKKQTLAGLFHDIATPAFKHCVDFMNGDAMTQESTEAGTTEIIENSAEIMKLLKRDGIEVDEVDNYHIYPIADNETPQLSADRLEYSLANGYFEYKVIDLKTVKKFYEDIEVQSFKNEPELGFKNLKVAREFVEMTSRLSVIYRDDRTRYSMQFVADVLKRMGELGQITVEDLYRLSEKEVMGRIYRSEYGVAFDRWQKTSADRLKRDEVAPEGVYYVHQPAKVRYIDPLCGGVRVSEIDEISREAIRKNLAYVMDGYVWVEGVGLE